MVEPVLMIARSRINPRNRIRTIRSSFRCCLITVGGVEGQNTSPCRSPPCQRTNCTATREHETVTPLELRTPEGPINVIPTRGQRQSCLVSMIDDRVHRTKLVKISRSFQAAGHLGIKVKTDNTGLASEWMLRKRC